MATVPDYDAPSPEGGYQRTPPYSLEAEISVLGSMLLSADAIAEVHTLALAEVHSPRPQSH